MYDVFMCDFIDLIHLIMHLYIDHFLFYFWFWQCLSSIQQQQ